MRIRKIKKQVKHTKDKLLVEAARQAKLTDIPPPVTSDPVADVLSGYQQWLTTACSALAALQAASALSDSRADGCDSKDDMCSASFTDSDNGGSLSFDLEHLLSESEMNRKGEYQSKTIKKKQ